MLMETGNNDGPEKKDQFSTIEGAKEVPAGTLVGNMDEKRSQILKMFGSREEEMEELEAEDLDVQVMDAIIEHLEEMGFEEEIENMALLSYEKEEVENRDVVYEDEILALTLDDDDEETGIKTFGAWVKV